MAPAVATQLHAPALLRAQSRGADELRPRMSSRILKGAQHSQLRIGRGRQSARVLQTNALLSSGSYLDDRLPVAQAAALPTVPTVVEKLKHSLARAVAVGLRLTSLAVRFAAALVHRGALQAWLAQARRQQEQFQQELRDQPSQPETQARLARQAASREAAKAKLEAAARRRSAAECAFCSMILRQDNPARSLEDKWSDLRAHMHSEGAQHFRHVTGQLFATARVSCARVQEAITTIDPAKGRARLDKLVEQHTCVQQEEAMRSMLFAQLLTAQQQ